MDLSNTANMGAWGLGLFQSDYDYDIIDELDDVAANLKPATPKTSIFFAADKDAARIHFDSDILAQLIAIYTALLGTESTLSIGFKRTYRAAPTYTLVLLGALAMNLGCILPGPFREFLTQHFRNVGLKRNALRQMAEALEVYDDGFAYPFGSLGLVDTVERGGPPLADRLHPTSNNTSSPDPDISDEQALRNMALIVAAGRGDEAAKAEMEEKGLYRFAVEACKVCGKTEDEEVKLKKCARCKKIVYCGVQCQKMHWKVHKKVCKDVAAGASGTAQ